MLRCWKISLWTRVSFKVFLKICCPFFSFAIFYICQKVLLSLGTHKKRANVNPVFKMKNSHFSYCIKYWASFCTFSNLIIGKSKKEGWWPKEKNCKLVSFDSFWGNGLKKNLVKTSQLCQDQNVQKVWTILL